MSDAQSRQENARTLAAALGLDIEQAAPLLDQHLQITWTSSDTGAQQMAGEMLRMLRRTFENVGDAVAPQHDARVEFLINGAQPKCLLARKVYCLLTPSSVHIANEPIDIENVSSPPRAIFTLLAACYAAAYACQTLFGDQLINGQRQPIRIDFHSFAHDLTIFDNEIDAGCCHMAGAGAVGNAFLYALQHLLVKGEIVVIDPKKVNDGILQRCLWFDTDDVNNDKAVALVGKAQPHFPNLRLTPFVGTVADYRECHGGEFSRLIIGVDSRRARRILQSELPGEVFDASTTGIEEVVFHHNRQPTEKACLACIYCKTAGEITHEQHIADMLNVSLVDISQGFISASAATRIRARYPHLKSEDIVGKAYDSLFKSLCSVGRLRTAEDRQVLAPFSFVSQLAGTVLAIEFLLRVANQASAFNYWRLRPWNNPNFELRQMRECDPRCELCQDEAYRLINQQLWSNKQEQKIKEKTAPSE